MELRDPANGVWLKSRPVIPTRSARLDECASDHRRSYRGDVARIPFVAVLLAAAAVALVATEPAAASVRVQTDRISRPSPFSPSAPCVLANPGYSSGYAQETSVAVNPRDPRQIL